MQPTQAKKLDAHEVAQGLRLNPPTYPLNAFIELYRIKNRDHSNIGSVLAIYSTGFSIIV